MLVKFLTLSDVQSGDYKQRTCVASRVGPQLIKRNGES